MSDRVPKSLKQLGQGRWRAGQVPKWAGDDAEGVDDVVEKEQEERRTSRPEHEPEIVHDASDRRLRRLAEGRSAGGGGGGRHREVVEAEVIVGSDDERERGRREEGSDDEEDEDALEARREKLRLLAKQRATAQEAEMPQEDDEEDEAEESDEWEYETDSEEEDMKQMVKPVFVVKNSRATIEEREKIDEEYEKLDAAEKARKEERKKQTRVIVAEELKREQQIAAEREQKQVRDDTDSGGDEEEEYDKWRLRELKRLKRDREERNKFEAEKADVLRRRGLSDEQVVAENMAMGKFKKERAGMAFLQKYYHKGAFFMENDEGNAKKEAIYNRNYNEALEEDRAVSKLAEGPYAGSKVLQVRRGEFGKMGRTKYTHLADQDTTAKDSPWSQNDKIRQKFVGKQGGMDAKGKGGQQRR